jgi:hypothetical protein
MPYYDPHKVSEFLDSIARGFVATPLKYALFAAMILVIAAILLVAYFLERRKALRLETGLVRRRYEQLVGKLGLSEAELQVVELLAGGRGGLEARIRILTSASAFDHAAALREQRGDLGDPEEALADLRLKLGFQARNPERIPAASSELPEGLAVLLTWSAPDGPQRLPARIRALEPAALVLAARVDARLPPAGAPAAIQFQNRAGLFSFATRVLSAGAGLLRAAHSEQLRRTQRRKYYRRRLRLPVTVRSMNGQAPLASQLLDLGGEGASLQNPRQRYSAGDLIQLDFRVGEESFELPAEILRVSREGQVLHVRFSALRDPVRDRLLGVLFQGLGEAIR